MRLAELLEVQMQWMVEINPDIENVHLLEFLWYNTGWDEMIVGSGLGLAVIGPVLCCD